MGNKDDKLKIKHRIELLVTEEDELFLDFDVSSEAGLPPQLIALSILEATIKELAEDLDASPEFLAEVMYHDFTNGKSIQKQMKN